MKRIEASSYGVIHDNSIKDEFLREGEDLLLLLAPTGFRGLGGRRGLVLFRCLQSPRDITSLG